jgi:hypothetical protein
MLVGDQAEVLLGLVAVGDVDEQCVAGGVCLQDGGHGTKPELDRPAFGGACALAR